MSPPTTMAQPRRPQRHDIRGRGDSLAHGESHLFRRSSSRSILLIGNLSFGILESWTKTLLAMAASIATEMMLGRILLR